MREDLSYVYSGHNSLAVSPFGESGTFSWSMLPHQLDELERHTRLAGIPHVMKNIAFGKRHVPCFYLGSNAVEKEFPTPSTYNHDLFLRMAMGWMRLRSRLQRHEPRGKGDKLLRRTVEFNLGSCSGRRALWQNAFSLNHATLQQRTAGFRVNMSNLLRGL